jgi:hypothetical protein
MNIKEEIMGAVARGWGDPKNSQKIMDHDLAFAISNEVSKVITKIRADERERCARVCARICKKSGARIIRALGHE